MPWECLNTSNTKQILDTDLLKTVLGHVAWNPTKSAEPFQWCVLALNSWIADFVNIILSWKEQLSLTCLPCSVARHLALFDKSKSREKESFDRSTRSIGIPEQLWSCGRIWTLDKGKHYSYSVLNLCCHWCCVLSVGCVLNSGTSEMFGQGRVALLAEPPTLCTFISV